MKHGLIKSILSAVLAAALAVQMSGCADPDALVREAFPSLSSSAAVSADSSASSAAPLSSTAESAVVSRAVSGSKRQRVAGAEVRTPRKIEQPTDTQNLKRLTVTERKAFAGGGYTAVTPDGGYRALSSDTQRALYSLIGNSVYQVANGKSVDGYVPTGRISMAGRLTEAQIRVTTTAYLDDHPQVFWIANAYSYGYQGNNTILQLYSVLTQSECNAAIAAFNGKVQSILQAMPAGLSEFGREEYLFHAIADHCTYDDAAVTDPGRWQSFTAYGALVDGTAVCEGYSRAMLLLAGNAGLQSVLIRGTGDGVAHMWNGIRIDGNWYHLDITWCDSTALIYNYFNVDDQILRLTHVIAPAASSLTDAQICSSSTLYNLTLPACTSMQANYFAVRGVAVRTLDASGDEAVVTALAPMLAAKKPTLTFRIASGNYDSTVAGLLTVSPYKLATYLKKASSRAGVRINSQNISYVTDKADSGVNVFVSYL